MVMWVLIKKAEAEGDLMEAEEIEYECEKIVNIISGTPNSNLLPKLNKNYSEPVWHMQKLM